MNREKAMQVQVNTDNETPGREDLVERVQAMIADQLGRFSDHLTRVEVHIGDVNAGKSGATDKRCMIEARPAGHAPVAVTHQAESVKLALTGAMGKAKAALDNALARRTDHKGAASIRTADPG